MRKALWTLNIGNYLPDICALTYPWLERYAEKIGADFRAIDKRTSAGLPIGLEKLQINWLGAGYDWNLFADADTLIHPDMWDVTAVIPADTVTTYAADFAPTRFTSDQYFRRDGRHLAVGTWFMGAPRDCHDFWTSHLGVNRAHIHPWRNELPYGVTPEHLADDYVVSQNIARFGLKYRSILDITVERKLPTYLYHTHLATPEQKLANLQAKAYDWSLL